MTRSAESPGAGVLARPSPGVTGLGDLMPTAMVTVETRVPMVSPWARAEHMAIRDAGIKRTDEFTTARWCAHSALDGLGAASAPLGRGQHGEPQWPSGVCGSITHSQTYRAAVVAPTSLYLGVGVDAEPNSPLPRGVLNIVADAAERRQLVAAWIREPAVQWDRLLFSAKECVYKIWYPMTRRWLGFEHAELVGLDIDPRWPDGSRTGGFRIEIRAGAERPTMFPDEIRGRWLVRDQLLLTASWLGCATPCRRRSKTSRSSAGFSTRCPNGPDT